MGCHSERSAAQPKHLSGARANVGLLTRALTRSPRLLRLIELLPADAQISPDPVDGSCGQVSIAMSWNGGFLIIGRVDPDFV